MSVLHRLRDEAVAARACHRSGLIGGASIGRTLRGLRGVRRFGALGGTLAMSAAKYPDRVAVIDELGSLTFTELHQRSNALANAWLALGLRPGDGVAILARNHRGFLDATFAAAKCGARIVLLNTDFAGPQIREVVGREDITLLVHDDEYAGVLEGVAVRLARYRAWADRTGADTLDALIASGDTAEPPAPGVVPKIVVLTSGTTGTPKGANRPEPRSLVPFGGLFDKVPYRGGAVMEVAAPMFHALGLAQAMLAVALGNTLVIRRYFDPVATLDSLERHRVTMLVAVPVMLQRIVDLGSDAVAARDLGSLRIVFVAGSQLGSHLCTRLLETFGPVVYNLYGSTEVAYATIATPDELAAEPGSVGSVVGGATVRILDDDGREVPAGVTGRIFVANTIQFEGYTGGGGKQVIDGLMASGDVGHFDEAGLLFIDGRDDDMIVSGGENVFPGEVEELLFGHPDVVEAAAVAVADERFGHRLAAYVVRRPGAELTAEQVRDYVRDNLARFKVPRDVHFLDELPRNPTGKVLKRKLAEHARS